MIECNTALRCMALSLILIVVNAVDIDDALVILTRMALDLDHSLVAACLNRGCTCTAIQDDLLLAAVAGMAAS